MKQEKETKGTNARASQAEYYRLHTKAVDELVGATKENTPRYSKEELKKYTSSHGKLRLPAWLKVGLLKMWFYGAVCYFTFFGLGMYARDQLDLYVASAVIMGMATDLLLNRLLRFAAKTVPEEKNHLFVVSRGLRGFFLNIIYAFVLLFTVVTFYSAVNALIVSVTGDAASMLGVEPVLFGLVAMLSDTLLIVMKRTMAKIIDDAKRA